ncbi:MAG TPA: competence protein CoiA family protein [Coleofasciculaceae cyanobacterium]|jgi:competence CoiA-like predicted nuclease
MWQLKYGVKPEGELITIEEVTSGKTNLVCPFCDRDLVAKKGKIKQHHFTHTGETCLRVKKRQASIAATV